MLQKDGQYDSERSRVNRHGPRCVAPRAGRGSVAGISTGNSAAVPQHKHGGNTEASSSHISRKPSAAGHIPPYIYENVTAVIKPKGSLHQPHEARPAPAATFRSL